MNKVKQWILKMQFVKDSFESLFAERKEEIYRQSFQDSLKDLEETNLYNTEERAKEMSEKSLNDLLSPVDLTKIVTLDKARGIVYIGGVKADPGRLNNLKNEAEFLMKTDLWGILYENPKELASRSMFVSGETLADMQKGKSILYMLSTQDNILQTFKGYQGQIAPVMPPNAMKP